MGKWNSSSLQWRARSTRRRLILRRANSAARRVADSSSIQQPTQLAKDTLQLHIRSAASGNFISSIPVRTASIVFTTVGDLCREIRERYDSGPAEITLCHDDKMLQANVTLHDAGVQDGSEMRAIFAAIPSLHLFSPCFSQELGGGRQAGGSSTLPGRRGTWVHSLECMTPIVIPGVKHRGMDVVAEDTLKIACTLRDACPQLNEKQVYTFFNCWTLEPGDEMDHGAEIIVISNPLVDLKDTCKAALALSEHMNVAIRDVNWRDPRADGFNVRDEAEDDGDADLAKLADIMATETSRGFLFYCESCEEEGQEMLQNTEVSPILFGGLTPDGSIVGVLTCGFYADPFPWE